MAIAYPTPIHQQPSNRYERSVYTLLKPIYLLRVFVVRLFWHTKAYSTILGIMVLALLSIGFLWLYEAGYKVVQRRSANLPYAELNASEQK